MTKEIHGYKKEEHKAKLSVSEPRVWLVAATLKVGGSVALPLLVQAGAPCGHEDHFWLLVDQ